MFLSHGMEVGSDGVEYVPTHRPAHRLRQQKAGSAMFVIKLLASLALLAVAAFCGFGFLATFEPPGSVGWRIGYTVVGLACLAAAAWLLLGGRRGTAR